jgi:hypothetical protein
VKPLFGSHLLNRYPQAEVNIVESEKTAIIMANYYGNPERRLWLACGGLQHLRLEAMQPLIDQGRTVWLWPDKDGREEWQEVSDKLGYDKCRVYTQFFDSCWREEDGPKADVADIAIRMMSHPHPDNPQHHEGVTEAEWQEHLAIMRDLEEYNRTHPADEGFYEPDDVKQHTGKTQHIAEIINGNPYVQKLIDKLNLEVINEQETETN